MQVMRELRYGVKLKKLEHLELEQPREFELTPYEMLMEDISSRRYTLNKVAVSHGLCRMRRYYDYTVNSNHGIL